MSGVIRKRGAVMRALNTIAQAFLAGVARMDKSLSPAVTLNRLRQHHFTFSDTIYIFYILLAGFWFTIMESPPFPLKLGIPILYIIALLIPFTSQFFLPATPIFAYLLTFYSSRFIAPDLRPAISVSLLPTLESVLYGANISDILTRFTHPVLDVIAWIPYGVGHFTVPFIVGAFIWLFRTKQALHLWARTFGLMNLTGVIIQIVFPCSAPWYELIHGLTPANYTMKGSPGGLSRIDALLHTQMYTTAFTNSPVVFGAFPSLHAGSATMEALFISHFFPATTKYVWAYAGILYWATMYLTHHYLIDVVGGACLATAFFYLFLPDEFKGSGALLPAPNLSSFLSGYRQRSKYEVYDLEDPRRSGGGGSAGGAMLDAVDFDVGETSSDEEEVDITYRSPVPSGTASFGSQQQKFGVPKRGMGIVANGRGGKNHRHTASIASLIRGDERGPEDGWSPVVGTFVLPPPKDRDGNGIRP